MKRGDVIIVDLPAPKNAPGHEQIGNRPALVVHDDSTSNILSVVMIVPFTSKSRAQNYPHTIVVDPSAKNGLNRQSILMIFQLRAIDKGRIVSVIGSLENDVMVIVEKEMRQMLGLN